jgi:hypothetical protein
MYYRAFVPPLPAPQANPAESDRREKSSFVVRQRKQKSNLRERETNTPRRKETRRKERKKERKTSKTTCLVS